VATLDKLAHYEILEKLGEGGMGVVYKARDTHLDRFVAIKVLPPERTVDRDSKLRFVQEAKAASALSHPSIVTVHDVASEDGVDFMVMEYVQGSTLDARIPKKGLRLAEALKYGVQTADALAAAHAAGIIHRDLKPGNLMVTESGLVKVLDFGLAKLRPKGPASGDAATETLRTAEGTVMGTSAYMSPEQAEGRAVDARSDVFSYGAVLYEMVTGQRAFKGDSQMSTLSAVLRDDPKPPSEVVGDLPPEMDRIVLRCLRKDPARRFQTMADLKVALEELREESDSGRGVSASAPAARRKRFIWIAAGVLVLAIVGLLVARRRAPATLHMSPPVPLTSFAGQVASPALSPDGKQVAFIWEGEKRTSPDLYVKLVGPGAPVRLTATPEAELCPAWSPDGSQIAFLRRMSGDESSVLLIPALGGSERKLADGKFGPGIAWSADARFLVVSRRDTVDGPHGLFTLTVATGEMKRLTKAPSEAWTGDDWPALSPDGTLAFARGFTRSNSEIYLLALTAEGTAKGEPRRLTFENGAISQPAWTPDGKNVVLSSGGSGAESNPRLMIVSASASGEKAEVVTEGGESPMLSRDGRLVYVRRLRDENIWRLPLLHGQPGSPSLFISSTRRDLEPRFSPDGKRLTFASDRSGTVAVWRANADGSDAAQLTSLAGTINSAARWSPDGGRIVFVSNVNGQADVYLTTPDGTAPQALTRHPAHDSAPSFSRDGKWIYFASNREDDFQVWKMPSDGKGSPVRVTRHGGYAALESIDGRTLYFAKRAGRAIWALWTMPAAGGDEKLLLPSLGTWGDFDVTSSGIYYLDGASAGARLRYFRFSDRGDAVLATLEKRPAFGVAACPDDSCVLYTQFDVDVNELMLVEKLR
jgi:Tol biopolymer transport system component